MRRNLVRTDETCISEQARKPPAQPPFFARYNTRTAMSLSAGVRLGPYEIQHVVGAGGMGEVYRARDTRLDRIVAIKVLPSALAAHERYRERFEREACAISQLS